MNGLLKVFEGDVPRTIQNVYRYRAGDRERVVDADLLVGGLYFQVRRRDMKMVVVRAEFEINLGEQGLGLFVCLGGNVDGCHN